MSSLAKCVEYRADKCDLCELRERFEMFAAHFEYSSVDFCKSVFTLGGIGLSEPFSLI